MKDNKKIKIGVVDDEPQARRGILLLLKSRKECKVVVNAKNGRDALAEIKEKEPDIIFLDIKMPKIDGFNLLERLEPPLSPIVIFCTAHQQFAIKAFEHHVADYLLKPYTDKRFYEALDHAIKLLNLNRIKTIHGKLNYLLNESFDENQSADAFFDGNTKKMEQASVLKVKSEGKIHFIPHKDIFFLEGCDSYVKLHQMGKMILIKLSLARLEKELEKHNFVRIHKSVIVNIVNIKTFESFKSGDFYLVLRNNQKIRGSRNYRNRFMRYL